MIIKNTILRITETYRNFGVSEFRSFGVSEFRTISDFGRNPKPTPKLPRDPCFAFAASRCALSLPSNGHPTLLAALLSFCRCMSDPMYMGTGDLTETCVGRCCVCDVAPDSSQIKTKRGFFEKQKTGHCYIFTREVKNGTTTRLFTSFVRGGFGFYDLFRFLYCITAIRL